MTTVLSYAGQKGGAGKSTLAIATAAEFHRRGHRTLLIDADKQGTSATWGSVAAEVDEKDYSYPDVIMMRSNLHKQLSSVAQGYDVVIVDCPGRDDDQQRGALAVSDLVLVPVTPDTSDVWALAGTTELVAQAKTFRPELQAYLVLNRLRSSTSEAESARETLSQADLPILNTEIGLRVAFGRFPDTGLGLVDFQPDGKAALELRHLVDEIEQLIESTSTQDPDHD